MRDLYYTPPRKGRVPEIAIIGCLVLMVLSVLFMVLDLGDKLVFRLLFVLAGTICVFVLTRYLSRSFTYKVLHEEGVFVVEQHQGRRISTLCRLSLSALYACRPYGAEDRAAPPSDSCYAYLNSAVPPVSHLLFFKDGERDVSIRLELDGEMLDYLSGLAQHNANG